MEEIENVEIRREIKSKKEQKKENKKLKKEQKIKKRVEKKEERQNAKKKKVKLKKKVLIPTIIVLTLLLGTGGYFLNKYIEKTTLGTIRKNYSQFVLTTKDTYIYNKDKKKIGTIKQNFYLELEKVKLLTSKNKYFKIKNTNYYIKYNSIKKTKETKEEEQEVNYLTMNKNIKTEKEQTLYDGKKEVITLKNLNIPIEYIDKDNYYVKLFNKTLRIKKNKDIKEQNKKNDSSKEAEYVSVIYYEKIDDNCTEDVCLKQASVIAHITKLINEGYYLLNKEEYLDYLNEYKRFKEKALLISTTEENDYVKNINQTLNIKIAIFNDKDNISFETTNKKSTPKDDKKKVNRYQAKRYSLIDDYSTMASGADYQDVGWQTSKNQGVAVINYHFFTNEEKGVVCVPYESICLPENYFRQHLDWLKENNYKTLTIKEFADWMDGIIEIPEKSVLLTVDDGAKGTGKHNGDILIPVLEEYQMHATLFLITGWWDISNYQSPYLDVQSHTTNMHNTGTCGDVQLVCANYDEVKADLQQSLEVTKDKTSFCYPFYKYDNEAIQAIKDLGIRYAFAGGNRHARRTDNHYIIPRYPIVGNITKQQFANIVS